MTTADEQYTTLGASTLNGAILSTDTSLVVTSAATFPTVPQFRLNIEGEIILVTAVSGTTFTIQRAVEGPNAAANHANGVTVTEVLTAASLLALVPAWTQGAVVSTATTLGVMRMQRVGIDTTSASFTLKLPASPNDGDMVHVADVTGACSLTNVLTIDGNGHNIQGASTFLLQSAWDGLVLVYKGTQTVWVIQ